MIIAAFDLATATGACDGPVGGEPRLWSWYLDDAGGERPARLALLRSFLVKYFDQCQCDGVVYPKPLPIGVITEMGRKDNRMMMSEDSIGFARGAIGVLEATAYEFRKPLRQLTDSEARKSVLGWYTNRDKTIPTKKRVLRDVKVLGIDPQNDNEADAFVFWRHACHLQNPRLAAAVTPLFAHAMKAQAERP